MTRYTRGNQLQISDKGREFCRDQGREPFTKDGEYWVFRNYITYGGEEYLTFEGKMAFYTPAYFELVSGPW